MVSSQKVSSPVNSHSPSQFGYHNSSPLASPLRSPIEKLSSSPFRNNTPTFEKTSAFRIHTSPIEKTSAFRINSSPVEKTTSSFRVNSPLVEKNSSGFYVNSSPVNGLSSPLQSPVFRSISSPLASPNLYNSTIDTSSNVKGTNML